MRSPAFSPATSASELSDRLAAWVAAGLLSSEQAEAIVTHESAVGVVRSPSPSPSPSPSRRSSRIPGFAEALGYLGGMLAVIGLVLVVGRYWRDMGSPARLALSGIGALALFGGGLLVREDTDVALARLRGFLWLASTAASALFAGVLVIEAFDAGSPSVVAVACSGAAALQGGLLWRGRQRPLQQATLLGGLAVFVGALVDQFAGSGAVGSALWLVGGGYVALGLMGRRSLPVLTEGLGAATAIVGAAITVSSTPGFGLPLLVVTAFSLLALATVPQVVSGRADQLTLGILGGLALFQAVPSTLGYFGARAGATTGLVTWVIGCGLLLTGGRRLVRIPVLTESLGAVALIGGAALTAGQWPDFAPIFGVATAVGLVALGMLPEQVLLSVFGSVGLLVNVPWFIGRFFPGEGRVPLLILVSGALILVIAVLLTRQGDRIRRDRSGRQRRGPGRAAGVVR